MSIILYEFYKTFNLAKNYQGKGTELISLYIPVKKNKSEVIQKLKQQQAQADNIKLKHTKKTVKKGLETIISYLKQIEIPTTGLIIFSHEDELFTLVPPVQNYKYSYSCNDSFNTLDIAHLINVSDKIYGLVTLDTNEATFATLSNQNLTIIKEFESYIPGKTKKGGQSARRYAQIRKNETIDFFKKISDAINKCLIPILPKVSKIYLGGITPTVQQYYTNHPDLDHRLANKLSQPYHLSYTNRIGIKFLIQAIAKELEDAKYARQIELFDLINKSKIISQIDTMLSMYNLTHIIITEIYIQSYAGALKQILINNPSATFHIIDSSTTIGQNIQTLYCGLVAIYE